MSTWKFEIYLSDTWVDLTNYSGVSLVPRDGIDLDRQTHNKGKSTIDTLSFQLVNVPVALLKSLYQTATYTLIPLRVERDSSRYFTGFVRPVDNYVGEAIAGVVERSIDIEGVDVLWQLQKELTATYDKTAATVDTIVRELLALGGIDAGDMDFPVTLTQTVANVNEKAANREILAIIDDLLFEYHHCLRGTIDGKVTLFDWLDDDSTPVGTFDESIDEIRTQKTDEDYGYVTVEYLRYDTLFFAEGPGYGLVPAYTAEPSELNGLGSGDSGSASIKLRSERDADAEVVGVGDLEIDFYVWSTTGTRRFFAKNGRLPVDGVEKTMEFGQAGSKFRIKVDMTAEYNATTQTVDVDATVHDNYYFDGSPVEPLPYDIAFKLYFYGDVYYQQVAGEVKVETEGAGTPTARREFYKAKHVYSRTDAQDLASAMLQLRQYGSREWTVRSATYVPEGSIVTLSYAVFDLEVRARILRIVDSQRNATDDGFQEYVYTIETLEAATSVDTSDPESETSFPAIPYPPELIAIKPTSDELADGVDGDGPLSVLPTPSISVSASLRKATVAVSWDSAITSGSLRVQLQISNDNVAWFSLGPGGSAAGSWKNVADEVTTIVGTSHTHDSLPLGGTTESPLSTTYYYRARIKTGSLTSDWSPSGTATVSPILEGDIGADTVTANKITVADLQALGATIAGWKILASAIQSTDDQVKLRHDKKRLEILDAIGNVKAAFGYLSGISTYGVNDYGWWIAAGNVLSIGSGADFTEGDYYIGHDAAYIVKDSTDAERARLGSLGGGLVGLKVGDIDPDAGTGSGIYADETGKTVIAGSLVVGGAPIDTDTAFTPDFIGAASTAYADAVAEAERIAAEAYADGIVSAEEVRAIKDAKERAVEAAPRWIDTFTEDRLSRWQSFSGSGEMSIVTTSDAIQGGKVLRIGNNSGNDHRWLIYNQNIPYDPERIYRVSIRARKTEGSGVMYAGVAGVAADGTTLVNRVGANTHGSQHYIAALNVVLGTSWEVWTGYFSGIASSGNGEYSPDIDAPATLHTNAKYFRPMILVNSFGVAGITEIDMIEVTDYSAGFESVEPGADVTGNNISAGFFGQGDLATLSQVDWSSHVTGSGKPADNADVTDYSDTRVSNNELSGNVVRISRPGGGVYSYDDGITGAIKITLPQSWTSTMMRFVVDVYNHSTMKSFTLEVGGYTSSGGSPYWASTFARIIGDTTMDNRVRFGHDGSKCCIYVGESTSSWAYPKVGVRDFIGGHFNYGVSQWDDGWDVTITTSIASNIDADYSDALIDANAPDGARVGQLNVIGGGLQSPNYVAGSAGWVIKPDGDVEFDSGVFRGTVHATEGTLSDLEFSGILESTYTSNDRGLRIFRDGHVHGSAIFSTKDGVDGASVGDEYIGFYPVSEPRGYIPYLWIGEIGAASNDAIHDPTGTYYKLVPTGMVLRQAMRGSADDSITAVFDGTASNGSTATDAIAGYVPLYFKTSIVPAEGTYSAPTSQQIGTEDRPWKQIHANAKAVGIAVEGNSSVIANVQYGGTLWQFGASATGVTGAAWHEVFTEIVGEGLLDYDVWYVISGGIHSLDPVGMIKIESTQTTIKGKDSNSSNMSLTFNSSTGGSYAGWIIF